MDPETLLRQQLAPHQLESQQMMYNWEQPQQPQQPLQQPLQQTLQQQPAPAPVPSPTSSYPPHLPSLLPAPGLPGMAPPPTPPLPDSTTSTTPRPARRRPTRITTTSSAPPRRRKSVHPPSSPSSASEELPLSSTKTKSGRKIQRPAHFDPATKTPSRRRGPYRRNYNLHVCKHCQRGNSLGENVIVFCDGCNAAWHQWCHVPRISEEVVRVEEMEWFCAGCRKGGKGGEERRKVLLGLEKERLVEMVLELEGRGFGVGGEGEEAVVRAVGVVEKAGDWPTMEKVQECAGREYPLLDVAKALDSAVASGRLVCQAGTYREVSADAEAQGKGGWTLPPEDEGLVDDDLVAFSHRFHTAINGDA